MQLGKQFNGLKEEWVGQISSQSETAFIELLGHECTYERQHFYLAAYFDTDPFHKWKIWLGSVLKLSIYCQLVKV